MQNLYDMDPGSEAPALVWGNRNEAAKVISESRQRYLTASNTGEHNHRLAARHQAAGI